MHGHLRGRRRHSRRHIEREISPVPERILDVVPEYPQVEHVAADVKQPAVQEHRREDRRDGTRKLAGDRAGTGEAARRRAELEHDRFRGPGVTAHADRDLVEKGKDVQSDQADGDVRQALARDVVLERNHQRVGWRTTMLGRIRYRSAARATSWAVTASSARA